MKSMNHYCKKKLYLDNNVWKKKHCCCAINCQPTITWNNANFLLTLHLKYSIYRFTQCNFFWQRLSPTLWMIGCLRNRWKIVYFLERNPTVNGKVQRNQPRKILDLSGNLALIFRLYGWSSLFNFFFLHH